MITRSVRVCSTSRNHSMRLVVLKIPFSIILICLMIGSVNSQPTLPGTPTPLSRGLQRASTPAPTSSSDIECQRRHADWDRNRAPWSFFWGFVFYLIANLLLTFIRFWNTTARVILSVVLAAVFGPSLLAMQMQDALKVCPNPPGFLGSLSAAIFVWTLVGAVTTWLVICTVRYVVVSRQFRKSTTA